MAQPLTITFDLPYKPLFIPLSLHHDQAFKQCCSRAVAVQYAKPSFDSTQHSTLTVENYRYEMYQMKMTMSNA